MDASDTGNTIGEDVKMRRIKGEVSDTFSLMSLRFP